MSNTNSSNRSSSTKRLRTSGSRHPLTESLAVEILLLLAAATVSAEPAGAGPSAPGSAAWTPYALVVNLENLPKRYSCDELDSKFRDMLVALGAHPDNIHATRCEQILDSQARSPQVHLRFSLPWTAGDLGQKATPVLVVHKTIALQPGTPATLDVSDCVLLHQIKATLLAAIPVEIVSYRMPCAALGPAKPAFQVAVSVLAPIQSASSRLVIAAPAPGAIGSQR